MSDVAFLITNQYQIHHYRPIADALGGRPTFVIEVRDKDFGVDADFVLSHIPNAKVEWIPKGSLRSLDGRHRIIVCQTPVLPNRRLKRSLVVAQQYSLAKEVYQYGIWRSLADLNLMYGPHAVDQVAGFCHAVAVGNPLFDGVVPEGRGTDPRSGELRGVYLPTYGSLSSFADLTARLSSMPAKLVVKLHHAEDPGLASSLPENCSVANADANLIDLLSDADFVVSDISGAAYDAAYLGRPLILVGTLDRAAPDLERLSAADRSGSHLRTVSTRWQLDEPFDAALERARDTLATDAHERFRERFFANPGSAGKACAEQIRSLLDGGAPVGFPQTQVRVRLDELMEQVEILSARSAELTAVNKRRPTPSVKSFTMKGLRRARAGLARFPAIERSTLRSKRRLDRLRQTRRLERAARRRSSEASRVSKPGSEVLRLRPIDRRQLLLEEVRAAIANTGLSIGTRSEGQDVSCALRHEEKHTLVAVLNRLGAEHPNLLVRAGVGTATRTSGSAADTSFAEIFGAHWMRLSLAAPHDHPQVEDHWLTVHFVRAARDRILAIDPGSRHVDWTSSFAAPGTAHSVPTMPMHRLAREPIDIVYTWVDSSDPQWRAQRAKFAPESERLESADNEERYLDREELRYSLRSAWLHAPFVRHVFLVTAGHVPAWLADSDCVTVVTHQEIFPDPKVLPTFNSHAIEACLHRIHGLSEHFIYFNDDVFLGRECRPDDFFTRGALPKVRLAATQFVLEGEPEPAAIPTHWAAHNARRLVERDLGQTFDRKPQHTPFALTRSTLTEIEERYPREVAQTRAARFRSSTDLAIPSMFAAYYGIASGRSVEWPTAAHETVYADTGRIDWLDRRAEILEHRPRYFCLNSTRYDALPLSEQTTEIRSLLEEIFPFPSPIEATLTPGAST